MIAVTERFVNSFIHNRQVLKYTNKTCNYIFGKNLKETSEFLQTNKYTKRIINPFKSLYEWGDLLSRLS